MLALAQRMRKVTVIRYGFASIAALAVDVGCFLAFLQAGMLAAIASAASYAIGIIAHWLFSSRKVFSTKLADSGRARTRQKALFVASALIGLAITVVIVGIGAMSGMDPRLAKLAAIVVSFMVTYLLRNQLVFRR